MRKKYRTPLGRTIGFILNKRGSFCFAHFATKCCPLDTPDPDIALECARPPLRLSGSPSIDDGKSGIFVRFFGVSAERRREEKKNERWSEEGEREREERLLLLFLIILSLPEKFPLPRGILSPRGRVNNHGNRRKNSVFEHTSAPHAVNIRLLAHKVSCCKEIVGNLMLEHYES